MTALCGGGPSAPLPGIDPAIALQAVGVSAAVALAGFEEIAPIVGVVVAGLGLATDVFCASDPPAPATITQQDILDALDPQNQLTWIPAANKLKDWFLSWYWNDVCGCTTVATPPAPTPTLPPGVGINPGLPSGAATGACWNVTLSGVIAAGPGTGAAVSIDLNSRLLPQGTGTPISTAHGLPGQLALPIPPGVTNLSCTLTIHEAHASAHVVEAGVLTVTAADAIAGGVEPQIFNTSPRSVTVNQASPGTNAAYWSAFVSNSDSIQHDYDVTFSFFCSGAGPGTLAVPCCPPDPLSQQYLSQIFQMVRAILAKGNAPLSDGPVHAGLTNGGSLVFTSVARAIRIDIASIPPGLQSPVGVPPFVAQLGFVTPLAEGVGLRSQRVSFQHQTFSLDPLATGVGWNFSPGVSATITELTQA